MLNPEPSFRPDAKDVESRILEILLKNCKIASANIHCGVGGVRISQGLGLGNWDFGFPTNQISELTLSGVGEIGARYSTSNASPPELKASLTSTDKTDVGSIITKASGSGSKSSEGRSGAATSSSAKELSKAKPKAKAWEAPVYAEFTFG